MPALCIPAECDTSKYPFANEIASRWDAYCYATFTGISLRLCSISLRSFRITFAAYLPTHIKFLTEFRHNTTTLSKNHKLQSFSYLSTSFLDIEKLEVVHLTTTIGDSILSRGIIVERINFPDCKSLPDKSKIDRENKTELST